MSSSELLLRALRGQFYTGSAGEDLLRQSSLSGRPSSGGIRRRDVTDQSATDQVYSTPRKWAPQMQPPQRD